MLITKNFTKLIFCSFLCLVLTTTQAQEKDSKIPFIEFKQAKVQDAVSLLADIADINIAVTLEASQHIVTFRMKNTSAKGIIDTMARVSGLWYRYMRSTDSYLLMTAKQYQSDIVVFRDDLVRTFELRHQNVEAAAKTIRNLYGERVILTLEYKNDDFTGLPFEEVEDAITSNVSGNGNGRNNNNNRSSNNRQGNNQYNHQQLGQNGNQQNTSKGEDGTVAGEQLATLGNFAQNNSKQNLLTTGQLNSLQGQQNIQDQQVANITDAQTPIYITINRIHNLLFVRSTDESVLNEITELIEVSDKPTPQVLFEMEIIEVNVSDSFKQEFDIGFNSAGKIDNFAIKSTTDDASNTSPYDIMRNQLGVDLSESTDASYALQLAAILRGENVHSLASSASGGVYNLINDQVNAQIELLKKNGQARTLSKPVLLASNNRQAKIFIGDEQIIATGMETTGTVISYNNNGSPVTTSYAQTQVETERRKIGNTLYLMPSINADRTITIDILQDKSSIVRNGTQLPYFDNKDQAIKHQTIDAVNQANIKTVVIAKDGLTVALGGMVSSSTSLQTSKVPLLGDIPLLGELFTQENEVNESRQYIMLITPHIIITPEETADTSRKIAGFNYNKNADHGDQAPYPDYGFDRYIELTKFAMSTVNQKQTFSQSNSTIKPVSDIGGSAAAILPIHGISAKAKAVWQQDNLFVSAFQLRNHTPIEQTITSNTLRGNWLSATILQEQLNPFSEKGDTTWLYLVSDLPFQQIVQQIKK
jgi:general secretion pathway protein D